jgi:uncharacterized protein (DUF1501 family)
LRANDTFGFHPACTALHGLFLGGKVAVVQNVGYPNPNQSHFRSADIWETASGSNKTLTSGWIGRYLDSTCRGSPQESKGPRAVHIDTPGGRPLSLVGAQEHSVFGFASGSGPRCETVEQAEFLGRTVGDDNGTEDEKFLKHTVMDALVTAPRVQRALDTYRPAAIYPTNAFGASLRNIAGLIVSGLPTRIYFATLTGFDTHFAQVWTHSDLLRTLSESLSAFQMDLEEHRLEDQVLTMTFSEFGRRPRENAGMGTDHGTSAPLFVVGSRVRGGFHGTAPSLAISDNEDLAYSTDFRSAYATILERWLGSGSESVLTERFPTLSFVNG